MNIILKRYKPYILILSMIFILNIILFAVSNYYGLQRSWLNMDYLLLFLFAYYKNKINDIMLFCSLFVIVVVDVLLLVLQIFPFIQLNDLIYLSTFILRSPALYQIFPVLCVFFICFLFYVFREIVFNRVNLLKKQWVCGILILFLLSIFSLWAINKSIISSNIYFFVKHQDSNLIHATHGKMIVDLSEDYASKPLLAQIKAQNIRSEKILFIVNESWSETAKLEQQQAILEPILKQKDILEFINQGSFSAIGATVTGEVRELCQKKLLVMDTEQIPEDEFKSCIPNLLKQQGYTTYSIYGADDDLYSPDYWYPLAGLDHRYFVDDLPEGGECLSFNGRCDVLLKDKVKQLLLSSNKSFVYWLTVNSHAPYNDKILIDGFNCSSVGLKEGSSVCNNYKLHYQFFVVLAELMADPDLKGLEVYVVGDHPAPVANLREGLQAFKGSDVAWLHFKIKGDY